jgi:hypothetical protein
VFAGELQLQRDFFGSTFARAELGEVPTNVTTNVVLQAGGRRFDPGTLHQESPGNELATLPGAT